MACLGRKAFSSASKIQTLVTHRIHAPGEFTVTILSPSQRSLNLSMGHLTIPNWSQKNCPKAPKQKQQQQQQHLFELSTLPRPLVYCIHVPPLQVVLQAGFFCLEHRGPGIFWNRRPKTRDLNMAVPGVGECGNVNVEYSGDFTFGNSEIVSGG